MRYARPHLSRCPPDSEPDAESGPAADPRPGESRLKPVQTAAHWGVYHVSSQPESMALEAAPFAQDPDPSPLIAGLPAIVNSRLRIDRPYVRADYLTEAKRGPHARGSGRFIPLDWDRAIDLVATELTRVRSAYGNQAIYGGSYGWASAGRLHHAPSLLKRFLGLFGGFVDKIGNHSYGAALGIMPHVIGRADINRLVVPWRAVVEHTELMVMFGGAPAKNMQIDGGGAVLHENAVWMRRAAAKNIAFVNISPSRDDLPTDLNPPGNLFDQKILI